MGGTMDCILFLLDGRAGHRFRRVFAVRIGMALAGMAAVLSIAPFLMVAGSPEKSLANPALTALRDALCIEAETSFLALLALGALGMLTAAIFFRIWGLTYLRGFDRRQSVSRAGIRPNMQSEVERGATG